MSDEKIIEPNTFIEGEIIDLVPSRLEWAELYCKWMNNPKVRRYSRNIIPKSLDGIKKWFEPSPDRRVRDFIAFTIYHKKDKKPIGMIGLNHINWVNRWANAFISIGETDYWGKNIATEATKLLLQYAFEELNLNKVSGSVAEANIGSWTVAEKVGFKFEGISRDEFYVDGKYLNVKKYYYLKRDWKK